MSKLVCLLKQAAGIFLLAALLAWTTNSLRPDGLPLLHAAKSSVNVTDEDPLIDIKDAAMLYVSGRAAFVDARTGGEYAEGHVAGAVNLPVDEFDLMSPYVLPKLKEKEVVITYCDGEDCPLSEIVAQQLANSGLPRIKVLVNGWTLWKNEHLPINQGPTP